MDIIPSSIVIEFACILLRFSSFLFSFLFFFLILN
jgi:hypothetical protein